MKNLLTLAKTKVMSAGMGIAGAMTVMSSYGITAFAEDVPTTTNSSGNVDLNNVTDPIIGLINSIFNAAIWVVAAAGALYCILLGIKFASAEEPQDREKAKQHLKNAIIGYILIFVLVVALRVGTPIMIEWMNANS